MQTLRAQIQELRHDSDSLPHGAAQRAPVECAMIAASPQPAPARPVPPAFDAALPTGGWLPRGLREADGKARHTLICWVLALHLPLLAGYAWYQEATDARTLVAFVLPLAGLAVALSRCARRVRTLAASAGLLSSSTILMGLAGGSWQPVLHLAVVTALLALYEDWATYAFCLTAACVADPLLSRVLPVRGAPQVPVGVLAGFVVGLTGVQILLWRHGEQSRQRIAHHRDQFYEGQQNLMARMEQTDHLRTALITSVGHEFRAPLAGIHATLATVRNQRDHLSDNRIDDLLDTASLATRRLCRLLENLLTAATATAATDDVLTEISPVLREAVDTLRASAPHSASSVTVDAPPRLPVRMTHDALRQLVTNLLDNAAAHCPPGAPIRLTAGQIGDEAVLRIRHPGPDLDPETLRTLFEPFIRIPGTETHPDDGTRLGLYVVRRLVEIHGGRLRMTADDGEIVIEINLFATFASTSTPPPPPPIGSAHRARTTQPPAVPTASH